jgi:hypothetical protein
MKKAMTRDVVDRISQYLGDCSQKVICRYIGVTPVALAQNIERDFASILDNKVGRRLDALLFLLECAKKDETLEPSMLHRLITLPAFTGKDGWKVDVATAIHEDDSKEMLVEVFQKAVEQLRKPVDKKPVANGLYQSIHSAVVATR